MANPSVPTFDMVAKPGTTRVGFAYVVKSPRQDSGVVAMFPDAGIVDYDIMFQEFDVDGGVGSGAQRVQTVQRYFGVSVAYQANGDPAVAYLGGPPDFTETFWFQNDAAISYRIGGNWAEQVAAMNSSPPACQPALGAERQREDRRLLSGADLRGEQRGARLPRRPLRPVRRHR